ncbi:MAG: hypothetical protein IKY47_03580 [Bacteroidaceae bacterium]|nr:hypothetical protein [Bacteroidaceae bacterium]
MTETIIFNKVAERLLLEYDNIFVSSEYVAAPPSFPAVSIEISDSYPERSGITLGFDDEQERLMITVNAYSDLAEGKTDQVKSIMKTVTAEMKQMFFTKTTQTPVPNAQDRSIYRETARYTRIVGGGENLE